MPQINISYIFFLIKWKSLTCFQSLKVEGGNGPKGKPPNDWPSKGSIRFNNVCLKYRSTLPTVLNEVSFKIEPGEKIGKFGI